MDLEGCIRAIVREEIARVIGDASPVYSTATRETWPPGCTSRRMARDRIRAVPEHVQEGRGRSVVWSVGRDEYQRHHERRPALRLVLPSTTDEQIAERAIARMRATR